MLGQSRRRSRQFRHREAGVSAPRARENIFPLKVGRLHSNVHSTLDARGTWQEFLSATIRGSTKNVYEVRPRNFPTAAFTSAEISAASKRYGSWAETCSQWFLPITQKQASVKALKTLRP